MQMRYALAVAVGAVAVGIVMFLAASHEPSQQQPAEATTAPSIVAARTDTPQRMLRPHIGAVPDDTGKFGVKSTDFDGTIAGTDANHNGVRDVIERHIASTYADAGQRAAMMQFAAAQQAVILQGTTPEGAAQATEDLLQSLACLRERVGANYVNASRDVLAMMLNTEDRFRAYAVAKTNQEGQLYYAYQGSQPCV
ncbi:MAG: hypothetical protein JSV72_16105 [Ralstonia sp.]|nr:MAG: hypothetical protein JSV72_16105 [Ralstonia sp.]